MEACAAGFTSLIGMEHTPELKSRRSMLLGRGFGASGAVVNLRSAVIVLGPQCDLLVGKHWPVPPWRIT